MPELDHRTTDIAVAVFQLAEETRSEASRETRAKLDLQVRVGVEVAATNVRRCTAINRDGALRLGGLALALERASDAGVLYALELANVIALGITETIHTTVLRADELSRAHIGSRPHSVSMRRHLDAASSNATDLLTTIRPATTRSLPVEMALDLGRELSLNLASGRVGASAIARASIEVLPAMPTAQALVTLTETYEILGSLTYALLVIALVEPIDNVVDDPGASVAIAQIEVVTSIEPDDLPGLNHDVEHLLAELTQLAHEPTTSKELSLQATAHVSDGRGLLYGARGDDRELPPGPRTMYGWIVDALDMIAKARPVGDPIATLVLEQVVGSHDSEPQGLRRALETVAESSFTLEALRQARAGTLDGIGDGAKKLVSGVIVGAGVALSAALAFGLDAAVGKWPWLMAGVAALLRLVVRSL